MFVCLSPAPEPLDVFILFLFFFCTIQHCILSQKCRNPLIFGHFGPYKSVHYFWLTFWFVLNSPVTKPTLHEVINVLLNRTHTPRSTVHYSGHVYILHTNNRKKLQRTP
jgi:hypothetical protein